MQNTVLNVVLHDYQNLPVRTILVENQIYFVGKDVCEALGLVNTASSIAALDDDEKLLSALSISGQRREVWFINESGLYHLIFKSRKPEAKQFRKWVTSEVLPSLRRTGSYDLVKKQDPQLAMPFLDPDHYRDQLRHQMYKVARCVGPQSHAGKLLRMLEPIIFNHDQTVGHER